jgi:hypothetical protein
MNKKPVASAPLQGNVSVAEIIRYLRQDCYLSEKRTAEYLGLKVKDLDAVLPAYLKFQVGQRIRYRKSELDEWMESNRSGRSIQAVRTIADDLFKKIRSKAL